jgi:hypothetical protein
MDNKIITNFVVNLIEIFIVIGIVIVVFKIGMDVGIAIEREKIQDEAVKNKVAEYNLENKETQFRWAKGI